MNRKRALSLIAAFVLLAAVYYLWGASRTPPGQSPLVSLNQTNVAGFEQSFNAAADSIRLVVLLSPT